MGIEAYPIYNNGVNGPYIAVYDANGGIVFLSEAARATMEDTLTPAAGKTSRRIMESSAILEAAGRVWVAFRPVRKTGASAADFDFLMGRLLHGCFRLVEAEARLSRMARSRRRSGRTVRQLEQERRRIGRSLHTGAGQMLAAIRLQVDALETLEPNPPEAVGKALTRISRLAEGALEQIRAISRRLHPPEWQRLTLEEALRQLWELSGIPQRFESRLEIGTLSQQPALETRTLIYRGAQEAFSNIAQHAMANRVSADLRERDGQVELTVRDDGVGFDARAFLSGPAGVDSGLGLRSLREQASEVGGRVRVESGPDGTKLEISAPSNLILD